MGLAVASLTGRRAFAIGGYLLLLVASTVARRPALARPSPTPTPSSCSPLSVLPINFAAHLFPDAEGLDTATGAWALAYAVVVGAAAIVLLRRYRSGADA